MDVDSESRVHVAGLLDSVHHSVVMNIFEYLYFAKFGSTNTPLTYYNTTQDTKCKSETLETLKKKKETNTSHALNVHKIHSTRLSYSVMIQHQPLRVKLLPFTIQWSLLNSFRTGQGHCNACRKKWGFTDNELCDCGETQTMSHIVNSCPLTKFDGGLLYLHEAGEAAVNWLTTYGSI